MVQNKGLIYKENPTGVPKPGQHIKVEARDIDLSQALPADGIIVKHLYASFDPYQRGRMRDPSIKSYSPPFTLNQPMEGHGVAKVVKSASSTLKEGGLVVGVMPIEEYTVFSPEAFKAYGLKKLENPLGLDLKDFIGALGMPGLTAYSSFYAIGKPKKGETIFISAASGAVGQIVGQLAKHEGLTVIGSVGSDEKLDFIINELKFDGGFNYKKEKPAEALARLAPNGIDIYYENVGGDHLEAAIDALHNWGRVVTCGMVSQYSLGPDERYPIRNLMNVVAKRLTIRGFIVGDPDMGPVYEKERDENVSKWIKDGSLIAKSSVTKGIDNAAEGWLDMLQGRNFGKAVLEIAVE
jgi:NADPH-dependent curcumin reductase CurA